VDSKAVKEETKEAESDEDMFYDAFEDQNDIKMLDKNLHEPQP
jgi:hypothetical protein